ncbi:autoinducer phosphorelay protein LuxU [Aliivibrio fischeri ES114]|uniref:Autoinducer phosphorelay protein LuxU n=2 Tax=Aliivibrio fischeri TaxID=668 RepID=Q5E6B3_ALIF1|nr:Hpt domain-containing protein [Aliivibrio fischeri]AAW85433.1 autoinducer phosphorelay protein LuxU [Aliivibrio fischeri ES114]KLU78525.1 autoinducer [Aliivibrio fischeri]MBP3141490.1 Hpt domain-containing protein [Aliivibrio fischeri]MBP3157890.1 Hpt domain-containing protein [Aliivibrio fischeri]MUI53590.1 Hpt domain-containing protein [Aliivibrio fischeri]
MKDKGTIVSQYVNQIAVNQLMQEVGDENIPVLFGIFCDELDDFIGALSSHPEIDKVREISHCLKSSAGSFGADKLATMAIHIEEKAKQKQEKWVERNISEFVDIARQTEMAYRELLLK